MCRALAAFREHVRASGIPVSVALNHGCSLSLYFHDPEGNMVEVFWATGQRTDGPIAVPLDIDNLEAAAAEVLEGSPVGA
jgi:catechol-2,3-dioxygenase